ncbi:Uncharacterized protein TCM_032195 [Theobroma cacao]|uniref:Uncharacterized protein n=1 Tax=Theobroma cacao TaxID=3641 RepID=A0A061F8B2_THECC|nr:Uncharacterized protein TCM_032195 [Theobroma cacao]
MKNLWNLKGEISISGSEIVVKAQDAWEAKLIDAQASMSWKWIATFDNNARNKEVEEVPHWRLESYKVQFVYIALFKDQRSVSPPIECYFESLLLKSVYHYYIGESAYEYVVDNFPLVVLTMQPATFQTFLVTKKFLNLEYQHCKGFQSISLLKAFNTNLSMSIPVSLQSLQMTQKVSPEAKSVTSGSTNANIHHCNMSSPKEQSMSLTVKIFFSNTMNQLEGACLCHPCAKKERYNGRQ